MRKYGLILVAMLLLVGSTGSAFAQSTTSYSPNFNSLGKFAGMNVFDGYSIGSLSAGDAVQLDTTAYVLLATNAMAETQTIDSLAIDISKHEGTFWNLEVVFGGADAGDSLEVFGTAYSAFEAGKEVIVSEKFHATVTDMHSMYQWTRIDSAHGISLEETVTISGYPVGNIEVATVDSLAIGTINVTVTDSTVVNVYSNGTVLPATADGASSEILPGDRVTLGSGSDYVPGVVGGGSMTFSMQFSNLDGQRIFIIK